MHIKQRVPITVTVTIIANNTATCSAPGQASVVGLAVWALLSQHMELDIRGLTTVIAKDPNLLNQSCCQNLINREASI